jgi:hypothetical protein
MRRGNNSDNGEFVVDDRECEDDNDKQDDDDDDDGDVDSDDSDDDHTDDDVDVDDDDDVDVRSVTAAALHMRRFTVILVTVVADRRVTPPQRATPRMSNDVDDNMTAYTKIWIEFGHQNR